MPRRPLTPTRRDTGFALGFFLIGCALYWLGGTLLGGSDPVPLPTRLALLTLACATQLWRSRYPLGCLAAGLPIVAVDTALTPSIPVLLVLGELLHAVVLYGPTRAARVVVRALLISLATFAATVGILTAQPRLALLTALIGVALFLSPVWWARDLRRQRELADIAQHRADELTRIAELDRRAAVTAERARMARDLHDIVASHLSAIALQSSAAITGGHDTGAVLTAIRHNSLEALDEMRAMIGILRGDDNEDEPLTAPPRLAALDGLLHSARASGLQVDARIDGIDALPAAVDLTAYRIAQEALHNATQHAPGARTTVVVGRDDSALHLDISNTRTTTASPDSTGIGLASMRERAEAVGGTLRAGPHENTWQVHAELPLEGAEQ